MVGSMKYISAIYRCANLYRDEHFAGSGLRGCQVGYILDISNNPGITQEQLAQVLHVNRSNVTRQLALLEENGFVTRRQSEADKRATEVYPTEKTADVLPAVKAVLRQFNEYLAEGFTDDEKALFIGLLERAANNASVYAERMRKD